MNLVCARRVGACHGPAGRGGNRGAETPLRAPAPPIRMVQVDPVLVAIVAVLLFVVFALFLLFRRTMKGFADGLREGQRRD